MSTRLILIVGGTGAVGRRISADLAPDYPNRIAIGGRSLRRAQETATAIGHGVVGREVDVTVRSSIPATLHDVAVVINCIDQPDRALLWAAIENGIGYTDITPHLTELGRGSAYERVVASARSSGDVVLGTGIVPGISNVMARMCTDALGGADEIETALLLSAGDVAGPASFDYFLRELSMSFDVRLDGADRPAHAFDAPRLVDFGEPVGTRPSYLFPFSDQVLYPRTLGVRTALSRLAIEPQWLAQLLAIIVRTGAARLMGTEPIRNAIAQRRHVRPSSKDARFALRVDVNRDERSKSARLLGYAQADAAAAGAAGVARFLIDGCVAEPGAWMPEQIIEPGPFLSRLARQGLAVAFLDDSAR